MKKLNQNTVREFAAFMENKYNAPIIGRTNPGIRAAEFALDAMQIPAVVGCTVGKWLDKWAIALKRFVYLPFTPGYGGALADQVALITHEYAHIYQQNRIPRWFARYIFRTSYRAEYEVYAAKSEMEIREVLGVPLSPAVMAAALRPYGLTTADRRVALKHLSMYNEYTSRGRRSQSVGKVAATWWLS